MVRATWKTQRTDNIKQFQQKKHAMFVQKAKIKQATKDKQTEKKATLMGMELVNGGNVDGLNKKQVDQQLQCESKRCYLT